MHVPKIVRSGTLWAIVATVGVALYQNYSDRTSKSLSGRIVSQVPLQHESTASLPGVQVTVDGKNLDRPYLTTVEVKNDGTRAITQPEFDAPIELKTQPGTSVVHVQVTSANPTDLEVKPTWDTQVVRIPPLLLNASDTFSIQILSAGDKPIFTPRIRIVGVSKMGFDDVPQPKRPAGLQIVGVAVFALLLLVVADMTSVSIYRGPVTLPRRPAMLVSLVTGVVGFAGFAFVLTSLGMSEGWPMYLAAFGIWLLVGLLSTIWHNPKSADFIKSE